MQQATDVITLDLADGQLSVPKDSLMLAWLNQTLGTMAVPTTASGIPRIGAEWPGEGGVYAGVVRGEAGKPDYHLIVPTSADAATASITFGRNIDAPDANSAYDGRANTLALVSACGHPAAEWAYGLEIGQHSDFYLPARHELRLMWLNVPDLFEKEWHWSSTQYAADPTDAWGQLFDDGLQYDYRKSYAGRARAVRRLIIQ